MAIASIKAVFDNDINEVWNVVTSLEDYQWRSDLSKIEVIFYDRSIEYTKDGYATIFTITNTKPFVKAFLKTQQERYVSDLKRALSAEDGK